MLGNMLTPQNIISFIKNNADIKKIGMNFINSQEAKNFIENDLGKNYEELKNNLFVAFNTTKNSDVGIKKAQQVQEGKKLDMYKELANKLISTHRIIISQCSNFSSVDLQVQNKGKQLNFLN